MSLKLWSRRWLVGVAIVCIALVIPVNMAAAEGQWRCVVRESSVRLAGGWVQGKCKKKEQVNPSQPSRVRNAGGETGGSRGSTSSGGGPSGPSAYELKVQRWKQQRNQIIAHNKRETQRIKDAIIEQHGQGGSCSSANPLCGQIDPANLRQIPQRPDAPETTGRPESGAGGGQAPVFIPDISAEDAAYISIAAKLTIPTIEPGIGPEPHDNRWEMAVVGYPYWLWAEGSTQVAPVSDSSAGVAVSLNASLRTVVFEMGDGTTVDCHGVGTPYTAAVEVREKSPTCGHTYQQMSQDQPGGTYTVTATAHWDVDYSTPIGAGTIPITMSSQREVLVGELQTVIEE